EQHPCEQHALHLSARERADRPVLETVEADGGDRAENLCACHLADAAEQAGVAPQAGADEIEHRDRKTAVDLRALRQIGDVAAVEAAEMDAAVERPEDTDDAA